MRNVSEQLKSFLTYYIPERVHFKINYYCWAELDYCVYLGVRHNFKPLSDKMCNAHNHHPKCNCGWGQRYQFNLIDITKMTE